jgi:putative sigma-54 modulation protein
MNIEFRDRGIEVRELTRAHARRRLEFALSRFGGDVGSVLVRFEDVNGPRGGADMRCAIQVAGPRIGTLVTDATDTSLVAAIDRAADRIGRTMRRALERTREAARGYRRPVDGTA